MPLIRNRLGRGLRLWILVVGLCLMFPSCGRDPGPQSGTERVSVEYDVSRGDLVGPAHVRYRVPGGQEVEADVTLPWRSGPLSFAEDEVLWLTASSSPNPKVDLQCNARTNQGPYGRSTGSTGSESCSVDKALKELARR